MKWNANFAQNLAIIVGLLAICACALAILCFGRQPERASDQCLNLVTTICAGLIGFLSRGSSREAPNPDQADKP